MKFLFISHFLYPEKIRRHEAWSTQKPDHAVKMCLILHSPDRMFPQRIWLLFPEKLTVSGWEKSSSKNCKQLLGHAGTEWPLHFNPVPIRMQFSLQCLGLQGGQDTVSVPVWNGCSAASLFLTLQHCPLCLVSFHSWLKKNKNQTTGGTLSFHDFTLLLPEPPPTSVWVQLDSVLFPFGSQLCLWPFLPHLLLSAGSGWLQLPVLSTVGFCIGVG